MDHHANFLPWQALALRTGAHFRIVPVTEDGSLDENAFASIIDHRTKIFAFPHISNVLATVNDAPSLTQKVRALAPHALIILDAAQSAPNRTLDVTQLGVDFVAFSAHKCFGPTGVGILWGKYDLLDTLPPFLFGGDMVERAGEHESLFKHPPYRFEAGTSNISGIIAFRSAIDYIKDLGMDEIQAHEQRLSTYAIEKLRAHFPDIHILGSDDTQHRGGIISFILPGIHPHDLAEFLGSKDMCIRAGLHCAHPLHTSLQLSASARMSFSIYTSTQDIDRTIEAMHEAHKRYV